MRTPYKMKGSPMQRNFGIGSPLREETNQAKYKKVRATKGSDETKLAAVTEAYGDRGWKVGTDEKGNTRYMDEAGQSPKQVAVSQSKESQRTKRVKEGENPITQKRTLLQRLTNKTSTGKKTVRVKKVKKSKYRKTKEGEIKASKTKSKRDPNWKVKIGNTTIGNTSNPTFDKKKEPTASEKKAKMDAIDARSGRPFRPVSN